jgi:hypothetical protein
MPSSVPPRHVHFDRTPEIFATDSAGRFSFLLTLDGDSSLNTSPFDEVRLLVSLWHPSSTDQIDLDRAYVEVQGSFDASEGHWVRLAEIEPVVPPYNSGETFDGWVVLPVMATESAFTLSGGGFQPRTRLQIRASVYLVA